MPPAAWLLNLLAALAVALCVLHGPSVGSQAGSNGGMGGMPPMLALPSL